jgi:hypothetical protein
MSGGPAIRRRTMRFQTGMRAADLEASRRAPVEARTTGPLKLSDADVGLAVWLLGQPNIRAD